MENFLKSLKSQTGLGRLLLHQLLKDIPTFQQVQGSLELRVVVDTVVTRGCRRRDLFFLLFVSRVLLRIGSLLWIRQVARQVLFPQTRTLLFIGLRVLRLARFPR